ncbi:MAG: aminotransferase class V-fold PLP-dependent enzyme, partial [Clostridia bacterium]|nr:aminotransferase class V-fold PLP-dependent enzyme [Clostridia bacterium]
NGLKGVGALIKRKTAKLSPYIHGGGQENGLRSGTENVFGIKVFDIVSKEHFTSLKSNFEYVKQLNDTVRNGLNGDIFKIISSKNASPYVLSVSAVGLRGEVVMHSLEEKGILVGNGSACSSKNPFSRVIQACGYDNKVLDGVIRISFSPENTKEDVDCLIQNLNEIALKLKGIMKI